MTRSVRDEQLPMIRVSAELRGAVEALAADEGRTVSDFVRRLLIDHATQRVVDRETDIAA
jgi:uncharacterized protein (DUF1778 family)